MVRLRTKQGGPSGTGGWTSRAGGETLAGGGGKTVVPSTINFLSGATVTLQLPPGMKPDNVGPAFMAFLRKKAAQTIGSNSPLAEALDPAGTTPPFL
jgi:hypothetical protein